MRRVLLVVAFVVCATNARAAEHPEILRHVADVPLPGNTTRFDYQTFDPSTRLLYIAHMGDGEIIIFDAQARRVRASLPGFPGVTGVRVAPQVGALFASVTGNHEVAIMNTASLKVARIPAGEFPDGIAFVPALKKAYVSDEKSKHETVIDAATNQLAGTIDLGGTAGNTQYDPASQHIFVNVQSRNDLAEIDPATDKVIAYHKLSGAKGPHGLEIVPSARVAFVACDKNWKLLVVDMETWKVTQKLETGDDPDVLAFDTGLGLLYVARESKEVSVFHLAGKELTMVGEVEIGPGAHTVAVNPDTHEVYFPLEDVNGHPVLRIVRPVQ